MADLRTVYLVDDDTGALRSLCWLLEQADLPVRAFASGHEFLEAYNPQEAGCLVLDMRMPGMGGLDVQQRLQELGDELPIIFLTAHGDVATCAKAFKSGAFDFLEKPVDDEVLLRHVRGALARSAQQPRRAAFAALVGQLTPREKEVFDLLVVGRSLKEIASALDITVQTVWRHRDSLLRKMHVSNDVELARLATRYGYEGG